MSGMRLPKGERCTSSSCSSTAREKDQSLRIFHMGAFIHTVGSPRGPVYRPRVDQDHRQMTILEVKSFGVIYRRRAAHSICVGAR
jgi:hypothetical protein